MLAEAPRLLAERGFDGCLLLTTARCRTAAPAVVAGAADTVEVPAGRVDELSAAIRPRVERRPLVALGGGRVVDTAKALAGADGLVCAAIPTTLSGAELTGFHRLPAGSQGGRLVRPALVIADPALTASQPAPELAASALNALAHAVEALYTPLSNPVARMTALRAASLIRSGLVADEPQRDELALGGLLAAYASGLTGYAFHHAVCQTIVRVAGTPHAQTNAVMLPHSVRFMVERAPEAIGALARALAGGPAGAPDAAEEVERLVARTGVRSLSDLGVDAASVDAIVDAAAGRGELANAPEPPSPSELRELVEAAL